HFRICDPLSQLRIEAGAPLLDKRKVESRRVGDRLNVLRRIEIIICAGNTRKMSGTQPRYGLRKREPRIEIGILRAASVARPPTRIHFEQHEVGEPSDLLRTGRLTAWQRAKRIEIDRIRVLRR